MMRRDFVIKVRDHAGQKVLRAELPLMIEWLTQDPVRPERPQICATTVDVLFTDLTMPGSIGRCRLGCRTGGPA
jgi:hypothetical protein